MDGVERGYLPRKHFNKEQLINTPFIWSDINPNWQLKKLKISMHMCVGRRERENELNIHTYVC